MSPYAAMITPAPAPPLDTPTPTIQDLVKRQSITTLKVTQVPSGATSAVAEKKGFPVAVAVPALVGGMALAVLGFLGYWWLQKRRRRENQRRWEAHQRRQARKRANSAASRPSVSTARPSMSASRGQSNSSSVKSPINEKPPVPPVPTLSKDQYSAPAQQYQHVEKGYGYSANQISTDYQSQNQYSQQPSIDYEPEPAHTAVSLEAPVSTSSSSTSGSGEKPRSSRSTARVAAAEKAAEANFGDINTRYQPKKPSPLALKALAEKQRLGLATDQDSPFRSPTEPISPLRNAAPDQLYVPNDPYYGQDQVQQGQRQTSGEWGVALGSPNHDGSFSLDRGPSQNQGQGPNAQRSSYSNDPYLAGTAAYGDKAKSGQYSYDPYAAYHGDEEVVDDVDYHGVASNMKKNGSGWV